MVASSLGPFVVVDFERSRVSATLLGFPDAEVRSSSVTTPVALRRGDVWCQKNAYIKVGLNLKPITAFNLCIYIYIFFFWGGGKVNYI